MLRERERSEDRPLGPVPGGAGVVLREPGLCPCPSPASGRRKVCARVPAAGRARSSDRGGIADGDRRGLRICTDGLRVEGGVGGGGRRGPGGSLSASVPMGSALSEAVIPLLR